MTLVMSIFMEKYSHWTKTPGSFPVYKFSSLFRFHSQISVFIFKNPYLEFQPSKLNVSKSYELLIKSNFWENWFQDFITCQKFPVYKNVNTVWLTSQKLRSVCKIHIFLYKNPKITKYLLK